MKKSDNENFGGKRQSLLSRTLGNNRYKMIIVISSFVALVIHSGLLALFSYLQIPFMVWLNRISLVIYAINIICVFYLNSHLFPLAVSFFEVIFHQVAAVYFLGMTSGFQFYLIFPIMLPFLVRKKQSVMMTIDSFFSVIVFVAIDIVMSGRNPAYVCDPKILHILRYCNISGTAVLLFVVSIIFTRMVSSAEKKATQLMDNILPPVISRRLKENPQATVSVHKTASVLFLDIVGFTHMSEILGNEKLVHILNELFSRFDRLVDGYHVEKIKTIGDSYMVACGLPEFTPKHCHFLACFALRLLHEVGVFNTEHNITLQVRIGMNTGPVVAGVIGMKKFIYDLWGSTVNTASRMESTGVPGKIQVTQAVQQEIKDYFRFAERGLVEVKGIGPCKCYFLEGMQPRPAA